MECGPRDAESLNEHTKCVHSTKGGKVRCPGDSVSDWVCAGGGRRLQRRLHEGGGVSVWGSVLVSSMNQGLPFCREALAYSSPGISGIETSTDAHHELPALCS